MNGAIDIRLMHALYEDADNETREIVDRCFDSVSTVLRNAAIYVPGDDTAEELVAAIMYFVVQSRTLAPTLTKTVIVDLLLKTRRGMTLVEIAQATGAELATVKGSLSVLQQERKIQQCAPGVFYITGYAEADRLRNLEQSANGGTS